MGHGVMFGGIRIFFVHIVHVSTSAPIRMAHPEVLFIIH